MASLATEGQLHPVLVVASNEEGDAGAGYVLIDGYRRAKALKRLNRDTVTAVVLPLTESSALLYHHSQESVQPRTAFEDGWLLRELIELHGMSQAEVSRQLQRSESWVSRRLSLVRELPESAQALVRQGKLCSHGAMKYLVPLARAKMSSCKEVVRHLTGRTTARELKRVYHSWKNGDADQRHRIETHPELFLKAVEILEKRPVFEGDEIQDISNDMAILDAVSGRVRRRISKMDGVTIPDVVIESYRMAQSSFSALAEVMEKRIDVGPRDKSGDSASQGGGTGDLAHRSGAEDIAQYG
jgi:ParB family chromosome partitioning protein